LYLLELISVGCWTDEPRTQLFPLYQPINNQYLDNFFESKELNGCRKYAGALHESWQICILCFMAVDRNYQNLEALQANGQIKLAQLERKL
jgi:hypothetical protein